MTCVPNKGAEDVAAGRVDGITSRNIPSSFTTRFRR